MEHVIPRWEWRTFGDSFGAADERFAALEIEAVQESDEVYFVSIAGDATVKVRGGLMDIKTLEETDGDGLEQWRPVMKAGFPIALAQANEACVALRVPPIAMGRGSLTIGELRAELEAIERGVRAVEVHKRRVRYTVNGCVSEVTEVVADGRRVRTIAIESEDPRRVVAAVEQMGLTGLANTSYPRWLKAAFGGSE